VSSWARTWWCRSQNWSCEKGSGRFGLIVFVIGVLANEILLMTQGVAAIDTTTVPYMNVYLLLAVLLMLLGLLLFAYSQWATANFTEENAKNQL
jgi:membrane protein implicated in regulation of membrane protease activity